MSLTLLGVFIVMKVLSAIFILSGVFISIIYKDITILFALHILAYSIIYVGYRICTDQLITYMIDLESDEERSEHLFEFRYLADRLKDLLVMFTRFHYIILWLPAIGIYPDWSQIGLFILFICERVLIDYTYLNFKNKLLTVYDMIRLNIFNKI